MKRIIFIVSILCLCSISIFGQSLPALELSKEIIKGSLPNGIEYYLINNSFQKGFADYAVVQKEDLDNDKDKKALTYLPHFGFRKPYNLMSESGVGFHKNGFVTKLPDATYFYFKDVPAYKSAVADSTLLMIMDLAAVSRKPQAIIISGDIDIAKIKERMSLLSIMSGKLENEGQAIEHQWETTDSLKLISSPNYSKNTATIEAIYRNKRQSKEEMNTVLPLIIRSYSNILERIISERLKKAFEANNIPLAHFDFSYSDSSQGPFDELFSFKLYTSASCLQKATELLSKELAAIDINGATIDEIELASVYDTPNSTIKQFERHITNEEYINKCVASYLYGSNLAPEASVNNMINNRNLGSQQQQRLFNNYASALLDSNKNLTLRFTSPNDIEEDVLKKTFLSAWKSPSGQNNGRSIPRFIKGNNKAKIKTEAAEPISGGLLWTFSNGVKVVYKQLSTKGEMTYSLVLNSGLSSIQNLQFGEAPFVNKIFDISKIAGADCDEFKNYLAKEGISVSQNVDVSSIEISGSAPNTKLEMVLEAIQSVVNDSNINFEAFERIKQNAIIQQDMQALSARNPNEKMYSVLLSDFAYANITKAESLSDDFCKRVEVCFQDAYSKVNDGVLILCGDLAVEDVKKSLNKYIGNFRTDSKPAQRIPVKASYFRGIASLEDEAAVGAIGGKELSANVALSASLAYSAANQAAFEAAVEFIRKELAQALVDKGAYFELKPEMGLYPSEHISLYINVRPCNANGLPLGVVPVSPDELMESLLEVVTNLENIEITSQDIAAYSALLSSEFNATKSNPSVLNKALKLRYSNGKDMLSSKESAIKNLNESKIRSVLFALSSGTRVEYIIK